MIKFEDFEKIELRVATILSAKAHPNANRMLVLQVSVGEETRQIVAGIKAHYDPETLVGTKIVIVANLEPRDLRGEISHGMLLAAKDEKDLRLIRPDGEIASGSKVG